MPSRARYIPIVTACVYIDGFNFYYGLAKPLNCKWVDLRTYFQRLYRSDDIKQILFFQAKILGPHLTHQEAYLNALSDMGVDVVLGEMKRKRRHCRVSQCHFSGDRTWPDAEEKFTDVSIGIQMVHDAHRAAFEKQILVTADTDLVPAIRLAKVVRPQTQISLCIPALHKARIWGAAPIGAQVDRATQANADLLVKCQWPAVFTSPAGTVHRRPGAWQEAPLTAATDWRHLNGNHHLPVLPKWCR